jgi:16S rRNA (guanine527-N7)-methyltransferase
MSRVAGSLGAGGSGAGRSEGRGDGRRGDCGEELSQAARLVLGQGYEAVAALAEALEAEGELRGLIGPAEVGRLWERHLLNSAAAAPFLPGDGASLIDVGSGAGLPGLVLAAMRPGLAVELVEPMARRTDWLEEVVAYMGLGNVEVTHARAEDLRGWRDAEAITARAVAPLGKLARMTAPLVCSGGTMIALKGRQAGAELERDESSLRAAGWLSPQVHEITIPASGATHIITAHRA